MLNSNTPGPQERSMLVASDITRVLNSSELILLPVGYGTLRVSASQCCVTPVSEFLKPTGVFNGSEHAYYNEAGRWWK